MLFRKKKEETVDTAAQDIQQLKDFIAAFMQDTTYKATVDTSLFNDKELAEKVNDLLFYLKQHNNNYAMRLNLAMNEIGDQSYLRDMVVKVSSQTDSIKEMQTASGQIDNSINRMSYTIGDIKADTNRMLDTLRNSITSINGSIQIVSDSSEHINTINAQTQVFKDKVEKISNIIDIVKDVAEQSDLLALNASIEAARAGDAGKGFAIVAEQVRSLSINTSDSAEEIVKYVNELKQDIDDLALSMKNTSQQLASGNEKVEASLREINNMNDTMTNVESSLSDIYSDMNTQAKTVKKFSEQIDAITESYETLSKECFDTGVHIFKIGRYIDTSRNDLVRAFTEITDVDWMHVFAVDHYVLMWRLYSNAADFEHLRIQQLNNPDRCKFAVWCGRQTDKRILESRELKELSDAHLLVHEYACNSWYAKEEGNVDKALEEFQKCFDAYYVFKDKIDAMCKFLVSIGDGEETEIRVFGK